MIEAKVKYRKPYWNIDYPEVAKNFEGSTFLAETSFWKVDGGWSEAPAGIFFQPNHDRTDHYDHFAIFSKIQTPNDLFICGVPKFDPWVYGMINNATGELIWSQYGNDAVYSEDNNVMIDGGRDYCRYGVGENQRKNWGLVMYNIVTNETKAAIPYGGENQESK